jgi:hypothetical protein
MSNDLRYLFSTWETSIAAATTIAARMPILFAAATSGSPKAMREARRMCTEKHTAAVEGAIAAGQEWMRLWMRAGAMGSWVEAQQGMSQIMRAAMGPANRVCRANAQRLTRRRTRRRRRA